MNTAFQKTHALWFRNGSKWEATGRAVQARIDGGVVTFTVNHPIELTGNFDYALHPLAEE